MWTNVSIVLEVNLLVGGLSFWGAFCSRQLTCIGFYELAKGKECFRSEQWAMLTMQNSKWSRNSSRDFQRFKVLVNFDLLKLAILERKRTDSKQIFSFMWRGNLGEILFFEVRGNNAFSGNSSGKTLEQVPGSFIGWCNGGFQKVNTAFVKPEWIEKNVDKRT